MDYNLKRWIALTRSRTARGSPVVMCAFDQGAGRDRRAPVGGAGEDRIRGMTPRGLAPLHPLPIAIRLEPETGMPSAPCSENERLLGVTKRAMPSSLSALLV